MFKKPLSTSPMSSLYTMQQHKSIVSFLPTIWTSVSEAIKYHLNSLDVPMKALLSLLQYDVKLFLGMNTFFLSAFESICLLKERARFKIRIQTKKNGKHNIFLCRKKYNINQLGLNTVRWKMLFCDTYNFKLF